MNSETWNTRNIGDLINLEYGTGLTETTRSGSGFPVYGSNGIVGYHNSYSVNGPGIIVGRKGSVGAVHWSSSSFWPIDTAYYVTLKKENDLRWCYWALQYAALQRLDSSTGVPGLNRNDVYKLKIQEPPYPEQIQIAQILDTVDEAIQRTEQLIAKLKAIKQGLLHDLLTRGLDQNGQLFKSRPESVIALSGVAEVDPSPTKKIPNMDEVVSFIPMTDVSDDGIWTGNQKRFLHDVYQGYTAFQENDVLFAKITPCMENGKGCHAIGLENSIGFGSTEFFVLRAKPGFSPRFIYYWTLTAIVRRKAAAFMIGSAGQQRVKREFFDNFEIPLLPFSMQERITTVLDVQEARIQTEKVYLDKLKLIKKGLIHDLLTGKVRVNTKFEKS